MANRFDFQGLKAKAPYFEGWYVKTSDAKQNFSLALIPGIALFDEEESFVQYNLFYKGKSLSGKITFPLEAFEVVAAPYSILMPLFVLSETGVKAHLVDDDTDILIDLEFGDFLRLKQDRYSPSIMGPFEYIKMPCSHDVVSMRHDVKGTVVIDGETVKIDEGTGYIEKDRGSTFPSQYVWAQSNQFKENDKSSLFLSVADIDLKINHFTGTIAVFHDGATEHRFATYLGSKAEVIVNDDQLGYTVKLTGQNKSLIVEVSLLNGNDLIAPMDDEMDYTIKETVKADITLTFKEKNKNPLHLSSEHGAAERVNWK
ncbi:tocopherol cyclase family protein [Alkalibacterium sp. f15]|uniref:tocopherol cyclase family protein n=1 Tax=Alkalibacterium sp. f15 TaxID=3414029 RepID=UPI003BF8682A